MNAIIKYGNQRETTFDRIGKRWRERVDNVNEYEITESEEEVTDGFMPFGISYQEYRKAEKLKLRLLKDYKGKKLEDVIDGQEIKNKKGRCYCIESRNKISLNIINPLQARNKILSDLKLIYGIGEITECALKADGYKTIEDLTEHRHFGLDAINFLKIINECDTEQIVDHIAHRFSNSHPLHLYSSSLYNKEDFIIFDIETLGLFNRPIILFGVARISNGQLLINQYLLRTIKEEPAAINGVLSHIHENSVFMTFNGRTFDVPYIKERLAYYRMKENLERPNFDILHFSRRAWKEKVPNCRLNTLEKYLFGTTRKDDVPSVLVPDFYDTYMRRKNIGPLIPIIEHNKRDLVTLTNIFSKLHEKWR